MSLVTGRFGLARLYALARSLSDRADAHDVDMVAAGLSFYALLGLFPGLLAIVSIYGLIADPANVESAITSFARTLPPQARAVVNDGLVAFVERPSSDLTLRFVIGIVTVLWSSSSGMGVLVRAINIAYNQPEHRSFFGRRAIALVFTLAGVVGVAIVVPAVTTIPKLLHAFRVDALMVLVPPILLAGAAFVALLVLFRYSPYKRPRAWAEVAPGAALASVVWLLMSGGYSFYVRYLARLTSTYGALEGVIVLELWFYFSSLVLLYAAELNVVLADRRSLAGGSTPPTEAPLSRRRVPSSISGE